MEEKVTTIEQPSDIKQELRSIETLTQPCQTFLKHGQCCCMCKYHLPIHYHCSTLPKPVPDPNNCVCNIPKGWACYYPLERVIYDNWPEHSRGCELFSFIVDDGV